MGTSLTEAEKCILALVEPNIEDAKEIGKGYDFMEEYIKESVKASYGDDLMEAYDKEWALKD